MKNWLSILFIGLLLVSGFGCQDTSASKSEPASTVMSAEALSPGMVIAVFHYDMKEGVDEREFENFLKDEWFPSWNKAFPKMHWTLMKGVSGDREGSISSFGVLPDIETFEVYSSAPGWVDDEKKEALKTKGIDMDALWEQFGLYSTVQYTSSYSVVE